MKSIIAAVTFILPLIGPKLSPPAVRTPSLEEKFASLASTLHENEDKINQELLSPPRENRCIWGLLSA